MLFLAEAEAQALASALPLSPSINYNVLIPIDSDGNDGRLEHGMNKISKAFWGTNTKFPVHTGPGPGPGPSASGRYVIISE